MPGDINHISSGDSLDPFNFLKDGGKKIVNFAITNFCNAKCKYCSFHLEKDKKFVSLDDAQRAIDHLIEINTGVLALTGGEPFLNPHLPDIARYARKKGLIVYTGTNSIPLTDERAKELAKADISAVWISFESASFESFNENRGVPKLHEHVMDAINSLKNANITTFAISLINRSMLDLNQLITRLDELGFENVKFDYPMSFQLKSSYKGWSNSPLLELKGREMERLVDAIIKLKHSDKLNVINPVVGLKGAVDFYKHKPSRYPCYAGEKVLYLDWELDLYRCPALGEKMGSVGDQIEFKKIDCNKCYYQGVRDYDPFYYLLERFDDVTQDILKLDPRTLFSSFSRDEFKKLYDGFQAARDIRRCGLV